MRRRLALLCLAGLSALALQQAHAAAPDPLQVGVGRADITSPTGYYMQGWVRSDAVLRGVHTRIEARAIVLKRGSQKLALVAEDLNGIAGGAVHEAARRLASRGFSEANIIVSASHTHAAPSGYYPFPTYNTVFMTTSTLTQQNVTGAIDPQLYAFEVRQLVAAITRADDDLAPGKVGWSTAQLVGLTANRSLEAHLRDVGVVKAYGTGKVSDDPKGYVDTIDPEVQVLRVDKDGVGPVGMWSTFADHGTVNKYQFGVYNADHHGSATRVVEQQVRALGHTPARQDVVNAYGNTDEG
ncbi:MAG: neutral/alkaline non-lysosomal ceramidase N-terminal domain-containing protein, partial [Mycobacteriales bacterium]